MNIKKIIKDINTITAEKGRCEKCQISGNFFDNSVNLEVIKKIIDNRDWWHNFCCVIYFLNQKVPIKIIKQMVKENLIFDLCEDKTLLDERKRNIINFFKKLDNTLDIE